MSWQRRLRDIALAGGLAGGCATVTGGGTTGTGGMTGAGAATGTSGTGATGGTSTSSGGAVCNADPDPCCPCDPSGQGGYGGASCLMNGTISDGDGGVFTCQDELDCIAAPTAACCAIAAPISFTCAVSNACQDAGLVDAGCP